MPFVESAYLKHKRNGVYGQSIERARVNDQGALKTSCGRGAGEWNDEYGRQRVVERSVLHNHGRTDAGLGVTRRGRDAHVPNFTFFHRPSSLGPTFPPDPELRSWPVPSHPARHA